MKKDVTAIAKPEFSLIDENMLKSRINTIRELKVMLDADLAEIYGYSTKNKQGLIISYDNSELLFMVFPIGETYFDEITKRIQNDSEGDYEEVIDTLEGTEKEIFNSGSSVDINLVVELADNGQFQPIEDAIHQQPQRRVGH